MDSQSPVPVSGAGLRLLTNMVVPRGGPFGPPPLGLLGQ